MKTRKIIYWIATAWASLGLLSTAAVQLFNLKTKSDYITHLGYPDYALKIIAIWKILGVVALLIPRFPVLKEWAYAGFFFLMSSAVLSHIAHGDSFKDTFPSLLLLTLIAISWFSRPANRKLVLANR